MIFLQLFIVFTKIGIVTFGGGYAMISLIQSEVVYSHHWISSQDFTNVIGISQMTPGPIGINTATYVGYTAVINQGYSPLFGVLGSLIATIAVLWLPFIIMIVLSQYLIKHRDSIIVKNVFACLRPVVIGLIASAVLLLMTKANFGDPLHGSMKRFIISCILYVSAFWAVYRYKVNIFIVFGVAALIGIVIYGFAF